MAPSRDRARRDRYDFDAERGVSAWVGVRAPEVLGGRRRPCRGGATVGGGLWAGASQRPTRGCVGPPPHRRPETRRFPRRPRRRSWASSGCRRRSDVFSTPGKTIADAAAPPRARDDEDDAAAAAAADDDDAAADDDDDDDDDALGRARVVERDELSIPDVASARNEQNPAPSGPFADTHIIVLVLETPSTTRARRATALESS